MKAAPLWPHTAWLADGTARSVRALPGASMSASHYGRLNEVAVTAGRSARKAVLIDIGGALVSGRLPAAAAAWGTRLGISRQTFLSALLGGNDDQVLTGRMSEPE